MFGTSGIRGPVGEVVTADLALAVGRALAAEADRVVVGRDPRESGEFLTDALVAGLRESGTDVIDIGLAATPTVARAVAGEDADAGVSITASHNPAPDNGIKLWNPSGQAFDEAQREAITARIRDDYFDPVGWEGLGKRHAKDGAERHIQTLVDAVSLDEPLSVIVDVGNGAGGVTAEALTRLDCEVETLNAQPDGRFPGRPSEPTAETCESLCQLVAASDADLGIAHDGDADRMMAVTGDGDFISGDMLLALFALDAAGEGDRVAAPVDTSLVVADLLAEKGAELTRTKVGDVYVAERATEPDVVFGGEPSGAWIWPDETLCPDGPLAAVRLVELASKRSLAERVGELEPYPIRRTSLEVERKDELMAAIEARVLSEFDDVQTLDGVRVDLGDAWFLLRASGTQPLIRVTAEARDPARADEVFERATGIVADSQ
ncbi:phosphoglucosamine mutase [Haladaptatus sp. ZSTT2]|uniref:phosphoglucosamine mutase n=1 Tax=Haladaptatus sp. ZSTT2 TaxID=3120515 RepID=UPI00300E7826